MKIQILSDLHNEFEVLEYQETDADVVVLAGDIGTKMKGAQWALDSIKNKPVIYVMGNHEYYNSDLPRLTQKIKTLCQNTNVHVLENDNFVFGDVNFFGCTLWTDFKLYGNARLTGYECRENINDFKIIRNSKDFSKFSPVNAAAVNALSISWLEKMLNKHQGQKNIVVTHHAPSALSVPNEYKGELLSAAFASNFDDLVEQSNLWIHGHMHNSLDYNVGQCRVVCNPRGYHPVELNQDFKPDLVVEFNRSTLKNQ